MLFRSILRRRRAGKPLFAGDRSHVYDQLVDRGNSRAAAVLTCVVAQVALVAIGLLALHLGPVWAVTTAALSVAGLVLVAACGGFLARTEIPR